MDDNVLCPICKHPMRRYQYTTDADPNAWFCPQQKQAVDEQRPVGPHRATRALSVWTEARLDAWHSPA